MEKKKPEIRFNGFEGEWEKDNAVYIFETYYDKNHPNLPVLSASQELGMVIRDNVGFQVQHNKENEVGYKRVLPGQFVIHLRSFQGGFAHSMVEGITSPAYTVMQFKKSSKQDDIYWKYVLTSKTFIKRLETVTYGIRDGRSISFEDFSELNFAFPSISEQEKIGLFLTTLDKLITKLEAKLDKLRKLKQALLEKMFTNVNGGGNTPEIRFKGYTDKWEVKELREVLITHPYKKHIGIIANPARYPIIQQGNNPIMGLGSGLPYLDFKDKIIWGDHTTSVYRPTEPFLVATDGIRILSIRNMNQMFLWNLILYIKPIPKSYTRHFSMLVEKAISIPSIEEQDKIGLSLTTLENILSKTSTKLTKLRNIKQSLLQKMFV